MTRAERDALSEQRLKEDIAAKSRQLAQVQARRTEDARKQRDHRRFQVGKLAEEAGLCAWDDATLVGLFQVLARLGDVPDPVKLLDGLVGEARDCDQDFGSDS